MEGKEIKKCKKTLNILQIAATDKENLSSKIHKKKMNMNTLKTTTAKRNKKSLDLTTKIGVNVKNDNNKNKIDQSTQSVTLVETDLTVDNPSDGYWQRLAESCRKALDTALKENVDLHNKVNELEYENSQLKAMLDEAKTLVEVLKEMVEEKDEQENETTVQKDSVLDDSKEITSDSDFEETSFYSCV